MPDEVNPMLRPPKTSLTIPLLLILSIFSLSISGYLFWQNQLLVKQLAAMPAPTASPTTLAVSPSTLGSPQPEEDDPTEGWKTYTDEKYGFSFKHPNMDEKCCGMAGAVSEYPINAVNLADKSTVVPGTDASFDGLAIYLISNLDNLTLEQYLEKEKSALIEQFKIMADPNTPHRGQIKETTIAGQPAISLINYSWDKITRTYLKHPNSKLIIEISLGEQSPRHFSQYPLILSTLKLFTL